MFKVGDIVKCIDDGGYYAIKNGELYKVYGVENAMVCVFKGDAPTFFEERFIKVETTELERLVYDLEG